jgi:protein kinase A
MASETITNIGYGKAVDFWAFGVLVYELVSGRLPFDNNEQILKANFVTPSIFSDEFKHLVHHLIEVDTTRRCVLNRYTCAHNVHILLFGVFTDWGI